MGGIEIFIKGIYCLEKNATDFYERRQEWYPKKSPLKFLAPSQWESFDRRGCQTSRHIQMDSWRI